MFYHKVEFHFTPKRNSFGGGGWNGKMELCIFPPQKHKSNLPPPRKTELEWKVMRSDRQIVFRAGAEIFGTWYVFHTFIGQNRYIEPVTMFFIWGRGAGRGIKCKLRSAASLESPASRYIWFWGGEPNKKYLKCWNVDDDAPHILCFTPPPLPPKKSKCI